MHALAVLLITVPVICFAKTPASQPSTARISSDALLASPFATFFKARDYPNALDALNTLATQYPHDPLILRYRAAVLNRLGRCRKAIRVYQQLLAQDPDDVPAHLFLGRAYATQGNHAAAEQRLVAAPNSVSRAAPIFKEPQHRIRVSM